MSVDINWETLTEGPDGLRLAEAVRAFVHSKFQSVPLPRFIRSVQVRAFDFGNVSPEVEIKDVCDPLPDFYDEVDYTDSESDGDSNGSRDDNVASGLRDGSPAPRGTSASAAASAQPPGETSAAHQHHHQQHHDPVSHHLHHRGSHPPESHPTSPLHPQRAGIPGGTSNLNYFHLPLGGLSGAATPLAAVAGAHFPGHGHNGWGDVNVSHGPYVLPQTPGARPVPIGHGQPTTPPSAISLTPPSSADPSSRPPSQHASSATGVHTARTQSKDGSGDRPPYFPSEHGAPSPPRMSTMREQNQSPEDIQVVAHVRYAGDLRLSLTAEILLDYPMPSFVGIPLQLNVTGLTFDGVALVAFVKKRRRAHLCFLAPEDAEAVLGGDGLDDEEDEGEGRRPVGGKMGGLLEEIRVESEIGQRENGKQVLKNVGKVEKFVLEQVRRIFEDEFVYPSFWTFLV